MYQIFCHELEDMGNSLLFCFFFLISLARLQFKSISILYDFNDGRHS